MYFYKQIFSNLENNTQPKSRESALMSHIQRHFPILFQRYPGTMNRYIDGSIRYSEVLILLARMRSERTLQIENGTVRSRNSILGLSDPVMDELKRFQEAFGPRGAIGADRVPGTGMIETRVQDRIRTFLW